MKPPKISAFIVGLCFAASANAAAPSTSTLSFAQMRCQNHVVAKNLMPYPEYKIGPFTALQGSAFFAAGTLAKPVSTPDLPIIVAPAGGLIPGMDQTQTENTITWQDGSTSYHVELEQIEDVYGSKKFSRPMVLLRTITAVPNGQQTQTSYSGRVITLVVDTQGHAQWTDSTGSTSTLSTPQPDGSTREVDVSPQPGHVATETMTVLADGNKFYLSKTPALASDRTRVCVGQERNEQACADGNSVDSDVQLIEQDRGCEKWAVSEATVESALNNGFGSLAERVAAFSKAQMAVQNAKSDLQTCHGTSCARVAAVEKAAEDARDSAWQDILAVDTADFQVPADIEELASWTPLQNIATQLSSVCFAGTPERPDTVTSCNASYGGASAGDAAGGQIMTNMQALGAYGGSSSVSPAQLPWP